MSRRSRPMSAPSLPLASGRVLHRCRRAAAVTALGLVALTVSGSPAAADEVLHSPRSADQVPPGFHVSARQAFATAERTRGVRGASARFGPLPASLKYDKREWFVSYVRNKISRVEVDIDGRTGAVVDVWTGPLADWNIARGSKSVIGQLRVTSLPVWLILSVLFVLPFVDPRRPLRRTHLDIAAVLSFAISFALWMRGSQEASQIVMFALVAALVLRFAHAALRGIAPDEPLVPFAS